MGSYTARRILFALLTLFFITIIVFFTVVRIPESRLEDICEGIDVSEEGWDCMEAFTKILGLDQPFYLQYWNWMTGMVRGNFGQSIWTSRYVSDEMAKRFPVTFELVLLSFIFAHFVTVPLALLSTVWRIKAAAIISKILEGVFNTVPIFWLITLLFVFPDILFGWTPPQRYINFTDDWLANTRFLIVPSVLMGLYISAFLLRTYRGIFSDILHANYIRAARAKGLRKQVVFIRHGVPNALVPVLKKLAELLPVSFCMAIFFEGTIAFPGISLFFLDAIGQRDFPVIAGTLFILAGVCLVVFLITDLVCAWLDPRIKSESLQEKFEYL
ncbi:MAG: ABC transporter permease [Dehalococcoidales bacterium]|nr:ABC transporter permease [Dehalococcoidales bacterium]